MVYSVISQPGYSAPGSTQSNVSLDPTVADAAKRIRNLTEGRATELANDPYQKSALDYMKGAVGGQNVPFNDTVKNSILAQQGAAANSAEAAQMETLRQSLGAGGGSIYDPGYQAAQRQAMSERQGSNLDAQGKLEAQAGIANQQAQAQAANSLAAARGAQNAQINQMNLAGADYNSRVTAAVPPGGGTGQAGPRPMNDPFAHTYDPRDLSSQNYGAFRFG